MRGLDGGGLGRGMNEEKIKKFCRPFIGIHISVIEMEVVAQKSFFDFCYDTVHAMCLTYYKIST